MAALPKSPGSSGAQSTKSAAGAKGSGAQKVNCASGDCPPAQDDCIVGTYKEIKDKCPSGSAAHHVLPDMIFRWSKRPISGDEKAAAADAIAEDSGQNVPRITNSPSFNDGLAVCLTEAQHGGLHRGLNERLRGLPSTRPDVAPNLATYRDAYRESISSMNGIKDLNKDCKKKVVDEADRSLKNKFWEGAPVRKITGIPTDDEITIMKRGDWKRSGDDTF